MAEIKGGVLLEKKLDGDGGAIVPILNLGRLLAEKSSFNVYSKQPFCSSFLRVAIKMADSMLAEYSVGLIEG